MGVSSIILDYIVTRVVNRMLSKIWLLVWMFISVANSASFNGYDDLLEEVMDKMEKRDGGAAFGSYDRNPWDISPYSAPTLGGPFGTKSKRLVVMSKVKQPGFGGFNFKPVLTNKAFDSDEIV